MVFNSDLVDSEGGHTPGDGSVLGVIVVFDGPTDTYIRVYGPYCRNWLTEDGMEPDQVRRRAARQF